MTWPRPCPWLEPVYSSPAWSLGPSRPPRLAAHQHSHCLESGVTFSMSSMKFFRNSVLLSEAFRSLQYSLGWGGVRRAGLGGCTGQ